ncbi:ribonuclease HI [uncultured Roseobacter sp.]|uniref:ribonuclease HI n=1 Tax=uncultured Roseobacter sp. TaxID=114847 RepID=UPI0026224EB6|nr:ribonuclease HI [uncultured Roseobacter sp.]
MVHIVINTDGACLGNPGPGGYAASLVRVSDGIVVRKAIESGRAADTTNNQMELKAAIAGLQRIKRDETAPITLRSDSQYLINGMNDWLPRWRSNNWRSANGKPVKNVDLWQRLDALSTGLQITWTWVKGHSGDQGNEEVDSVASQQAHLAQAASQ